MIRALVFLLAFAPGLTFPQVGRSFTPVESYVALAESVRVGKISKLDQIEYDKPLHDIQTYGKQYRLTFAVDETIRGRQAKKIELVLALQNTRFLDYMRRHGSVLLMAGGPNRIEGDPSPEIGIEEDGRRVDGYWYHFRFLDAPTQADEHSEPETVKQIRITYNDAKMFAIDLSVVNAREPILRRARTFAKKHEEMTASVWLIVPNAFGELVGYANAFCGINLPVCPETERTLVALLKDPSLILSRIPPQPDWTNDAMIVQTLKCLTPFPSKSNAAQVRRLLGNYDPAAPNDEVRQGTREDVQRTAWELLKAWKMAPASQLAQS